MRPSRPTISSFVLVSILASSSIAAAQTQPAPPLPAAGNQADPTEVAAPPPPVAPPLEPPPPALQTPPVLQVPEMPPPPPPQPPPPPPRYDEDHDSDGWAPGDHFEFTMGFLAGQRSYKNTSFKFEEGTAEGIGGGGLVEPFVAPPFDNATVLGLRYDVRMVMSFIRMTVGFDVPFPTYKVSDSTKVYNVSGTPRTVTVQSLSAKELRFGIGGEYPFQKVALYADLIGGVHWVDSELAIDGFKANYGAVSFAFSGRAGVRAYVRKWFFATASGEVGIIGDLRWNAELAVGFAAK